MWKKKILARKTAKKNSYNKNTTKTQQQFLNISRQHFRQMWKLKDVWNWFLELQAKINKNGNTAEWQSEGKASP